MDGMAAADGETDDEGAESSAPRAPRVTSMEFAPISRRSPRRIRVVSIGWYDPSAAR
nr:hypothetical protein GCM10020092_010020 [Actinoplanes digitatis]